MEEKGDVIKLDKPGPMGGDMILVVDYSAKRVSLVEVIPQNPLTQRIKVWEVQDFTQVGG